MPVWYIMDEFGSRIQHSDEPSAAMTAFFFIPAQLAFTVVWPLRDLRYGGKRELGGCRRRKRRRRRRRRRLTIYYLIPLI